MSEKIEVKLGSSISEVIVKLNILKIHVVEIKFDLSKKPTFFKMIHG